MDPHRSRSRTVLALLGSALVLSLLVRPAYAASPNARIVETTGSVELLNAPSGTWAAVASPGSLLPGSAVRTGPKSTAVIELDGAVVTLYETSLLRVPAIATPASTVTNPLRHPWLDSGSALFDVTPHKDRTPFSVQTPTIVAGVKGTVFEVFSTGTEEAVYVWRGLVEVRSLLDTADVALVAAGQYTLMDDFRLTPALPIPEDRLQPNPVDVHQPTADTTRLDRGLSNERPMEDFPLAQSVDSALSSTTETWRDADRAAIKPALDQALDFQSVVSTGSVRRPTDSLTNSLSSTTDSALDSTGTRTDPVSSTLSSTTETVDPLATPLSPLTESLERNTSTLTDSLGTLGF